LTRASPPAALIWFAYCAFLIVIDVSGRRAKLGKARRLMAEWQPHRRG
jgi:hypothetical protein